MAESFLPTKDRLFLDSKGYEYREVNEGNIKGLIIDKFPVKPSGRFNHPESSLLIILPAGYPDIPPDMFYFAPELRLASTAAYPAQAELTVTYFQTAWQRWSRHAPASNWRAGRDGLQSYIQRVITALNIAS